MIFKRFYITAVVVALLVLTVPATLTLHVQADTPKNPHLTLENLGLNDLTLRGMFGSASAFMPLPSNWVITQDAQVSVTYTASPLLNQDRSTITISVNGQAMYSLHPIGDGVSHNFTFFIPYAALRNNSSLFLNFEGYLRLTNDPCEETSNPGQWVTISKQTDLSFNIQENIISPRLENLANALVVQNTFDAAPPVVFVLPDQWTAAQLTTAAQIAARLGKSVTGKTPQFQMVTASALTTEQKDAANLIVLGTPSERLKLPTVTDTSGANQVTTTPGKVVQPTATPTVQPPTVAPDTAAIRIMNSPWNAARKVLLIDTQKDDDLALVNTIFSTTDRYDLMQGSAKTLTSLAQTPIDNSQPRAWTTDITTFAQLGTGDRTVTGTGVFDIYYSLTLPNGWQLDQGSQLVLSLATSPALRTDQSYVTAYINDVFVGTVPYKETGKEIQVTLNLPVAKLQTLPTGERTQRFIIQLQASNSLAQRLCEEYHPDTAWTRVNATSYIRTPHKYLSWPDLQAYPYPFLSDVNPAPLTIVIPKNANSTVASDALALAAALGKITTTDFTLNIVSADEVTKDKYADSNLIVLGKTGDQPLVRTLTDAMAPILNKDVIESLKNPDFGVLREAISPWNPQRAVLIVYSESDTGYKNALNALLQSVPPVMQTGSVALVEAGQAPRIVYRAIKAVPTVTPTIASIANPDAQSTFIAGTLAAGTPTANGNSTEGNTTSDTTAATLTTTPAAGTEAAIVPSNSRASVGTLTMVAPAINSPDPSTPVDMGVSIFRKLEPWKVAAIIVILVLTVIVVFVILIMGRRAKRLRDLS